MLANTIEHKLLTSTVPLAQANTSDYGIVWLIVGVLAIIALLIFIIGRFR